MTMPEKVLLPTSVYVVILCEWLENWLLKDLTGNEKFVLEELIKDARKAAQEK